MCRYAEKIYKPHFVCFECRKSFKKPAFIDFLKQHNQYDAYKQLSLNQHNSEVLRKLEAEYSGSVEEFEQNYISKISVCPDCGKRMADLGLDFKAPKKSDAKSWQRIAGMYKVGHRFHTCGCIGFGYVPKNSSEYSTYLQNQMKKYETELNYISKRSWKSETEKQNALEYWADRLKRIKKEIAKST